MENRSHNHIIIFCGSLEGGGAERVISILSRYLLSYFKKVEILLYYDRPIWYELAIGVSVTFIERECQAKGRIGRARWMRHYIQSQKPTLVLSFLSPYNIFCWFTLLGVSTPLLVADRSDPRHDPDLWILRLLRNIIYYFCDGVIVQNSHNQSYFWKKIRYKCAVIPNPVIMSQALVGAACHTPKEPIIVSVGRLVPAKNHQALINSFAEFHLLYPQYRLVIYGEGPCRSVLEDLIASKNLTGVVILPGAVKNVWHHMLSAQSFVFTSDFEGMPNALTEAVCLGLPCVSTRVSGAEDLIVNGENGLLVTVGDQKQLTEGLKRIIQTPMTDLSLKQSAKLTALRLDPEHVAAYWIDYINSTLSHI